MRCVAHIVNLIVNDGLKRIRCIANIVNLIENDGLKRIGKSIECTQPVVRYVKQSPSRLKKFKECAAN